MRDGALPAALLCAALGLLLAYAPRKALAPAALALVIFALVVFAVGIPVRWEEAAFFGCWASIVVMAASIHIRGGPGFAWPVVLAANAGVWAGAVLSVAGRSTDLAIALPWILLVVPALWVRKTRIGLAIKIIASWLGAVAILAAAIPLTPTPGYAPDHRE